MDTLAQQTAPGRPSKAWKQRFEKWKKSAVARLDAMARSAGRLAWATLAAAIAMYVWGIIFWYPDLPYRALGRVTDEGEVVRFLQSRLPETGTYMIPGPFDDKETLMALRETAPAVTLTVLSKENTLSPGTMLLYGFGHAALTALLIGGFMSCVRRKLGGYRSRVGFVALAGLAAAFHNDLADPIWWYHPWCWSSVMALYDATAWTVAGLVLAVFIRPDSKQPEGEAPASRNVGERVVVGP